MEPLNKQSREEKESKMTTKTDRRKARAFSANAAEFAELERLTSIVAPGNISAAVRWAVELALAEIEADPDLVKA